MRYDVTIDPNAVEWNEAKRLVILGDNHFSVKAAGRQLVAGNLPAAQGTDSRWRRSDKEVEWPPVG